ncbi:MAG: DNA mismatch repair endonuclease MutL [Bacteroidota bacterium]
MHDIPNINRRIEILPDFIANQIAAGEVVQKPESAVKELVENSLDSGADTIAVFIREAGKQLIHVVDNGTGMSREDLELSCRRHATSKIFSTDDLEHIKTFGFRGEALASISSVANLEIRTMQENESHGWKLTLEPMKTEIIEPCSTPKGTQVFVRNLFFNVPARRKFLRSNLTEFRYIADTMVKFAIIHNYIRITFYDGDNLIFDVAPSSPEQRILELLGEKTANSLLKISHENEFIKVSGYVGLPHLAKLSKSAQYLYLNKRTIQSKSLSHAVYNAFEHLLEKNAHPLFILNLEVDPVMVDVNVHPQKHEVKFDDERIVYKQILTAVTKSLSENNLIPDIRLKEQNADSPFEKMEFTTSGKNTEYLMVNRETGEVIEPVMRQERNEKDFRFQPADRASFGEINRFNQALANNNFELKDLFGSKTENTDSVEFPSTGSGNSLSDLEPAETSKQSIFPSAGSGYGPSASSGNFRIWQLHNKYIFCQTQTGVMILDQHAAHERVLYEKAIKAMNREFAYSQSLLFGVKVMLNTGETAIVHELENDFRDLGYDFEFSGDGSITLTGVPLDVKSGIEESSFKEIIEQFEEYQKIRHTNKRDNLAASFSCKAAIKTGQYLTSEQMQNLITDLFKCAMPYACPHGRPTIIEFNLEEFDKRFSRT